MLVHARIIKAVKFPSSLHLSEGIFAPTPHPTPTPRPSTPFLLVQRPQIRILTSLLHPNPEPFHALAGVFQCALLPALLSPDETVFSFSHCRDVRSAGFGGGHPGNFHGSIALAEDVLVFAIMSVVMLLLLLLLLLSS
jgi:hypothetical protein